ncbi:tetratricopeptide repeat protein [Rhodospirillaceae bacterium SYSU D60014]|uniref:tetratricopeptide repeat protein n=1 Tax=Virgifigura deserti TaxID=2268457 RepID=UPI0013C46902
MKQITLAAEQGNAHAQNNLGIIFRNGRGTLNATPNDYTEAVKWFQRAAEQGHPDAQHSLGVMCSTGEGTRQSVVQAHMWLSLAMTGRQGANRELSIEARELVALSMTPGQITKAKRLARAWQAKAEITVEA